MVADSGGGSGSGGTPIATTGAHQSKYRRKLSGGVSGGGADGTPGGRGGSGGIGTSEPVSPPAPVTPPDASSVTGASGTSAATVGTLPPVGRARDDVQPIPTPATSGVEGPAGSSTRGIISEFLRLHDTRLCPLILPAERLPWLLSPIHNPEFSAVISADTLENEQSAVSNFKRATASQIHRFVTAEFQIVRSCVEQAASVWNTLARPTACGGVESSTGRQLEPELLDAFVKWFVLTAFPQKGAVHDLLDDLLLLISAEIFALVRRHREAGGAASNVKDRIQNAECCRLFHLLGDKVAQLFCEALRTVVESVGVFTQAAAILWDSGTPALPSSGLPSGSGVSGDVGNNTAGDSAPGGSNVSGSNPPVGHSSTSNPATDRSGTTQASLCSQRVAALIERLINRTTAWPSPLLDGRHSLLALWGGMHRRLAWTAPATPSEFSALRRTANEAQHVLNGAPIPWLTLTHIAAWADCPAFDSVIQAQFLVSLGLPLSTDVPMDSCFAFPALNRVAVRARTKTSFTLSTAALFRESATAFLKLRSALAICLDCRSDVAGLVQDDAAIDNALEQFGRELLSVSVEGVLDVRKVAKLLLIAVSREFFQKSFGTAPSTVEAQTGAATGSGASVTGSTSGDTKADEMTSVIGTVSGYLSITTSLPTGGALEMTENLEKINAKAVGCIEILRRRMNNDAVVREAMLAILEWQRTFGAVFALPDGTESTGQPSRTYSDAALCRMATEMLPVAGSSAPDFSLVQAYLGSADETARVTDPANLPLRLDARHPMSAGTVGAAAYLVSKGVLGWQETWNALAPSAAALKLLAEVILNGHRAQIDRDEGQARSKLAWATINGTDTLKREVASMWPLSEEASLSEIETHLRTKMLSVPKIQFVASLVAMNCGQIVRQLFHHVWERVGGFPLERIGGIQEAFGRVLSHLLDPSREIKQRPYIAAPSIGDSGDLGFPKMSTPHEFREHSKDFFDLTKGWAQLKAPAIQRLCKMVHDCAKTLPASPQTTEWLRFIVGDVLLTLLMQCRVEPSYPAPWPFPALQVMGDELNVIRTPVKKPLGIGETEKLTASGLPTAMIFAELIHELINQHLTTEQKYIVYADFFLTKLKSFPWRHFSLEDRSEVAKNLKKVVASETTSPTSPTPGKVTSPGGSGVSGTALLSYIFGTRRPKAWLKKEKQVAQTICRTAVHNPFETLDTVIHNIELFDPLMIRVVLEFLPSLTNLAADICVFLIIERQRNREIISAGAWQLSQPKPKRLRNLSLFAARFLRRYHWISPQTLLQSVVSRVCRGIDSADGFPTGEVGDYIYVQDMLTWMGACLPLAASEMSESQYRSLAAQPYTRSINFFNEDIRDEELRTGYRQCKTGLRDALMSPRIFRGLILALSKLSITASCGAAMSSRTLGSSHLSAQDRLRCVIDLVDSADSCISHLLEFVTGPSPQVSISESSHPETQPSRSVRLLPCSLWSTLLANCSGPVAWELIRWASPPAVVSAAGPHPTLVYGSRTPRAEWNAFIEKFISAMLVSPDDSGNATSSASAVRAAAPYLSMECFLSFWQLALRDLCFPKDVYDGLISTCATEAAQFADPAAKRAGLDALTIKDYDKRHKRLIDTVEQVSREMRQHQQTQETIAVALRQQAKHWFRLTSVMFMPHGLLSGEGTAALPVRKKNGHIDATRKTPTTPNKRHSRDSKQQADANDGSTEAAAVVVDDTPAASSEGEAEVVLIHDEGNTPEVGPTDTDDEELAMAAAARLPVEQLAGPHDSLLAVTEPPGVLPTIIPAIHSLVIHLLIPRGMHSPADAMYAQEFLWTALKAGGPHVSLVACIWPCIAASVGALLGTTDREGDSLGVFFMELLKNVTQLANASSKELQDFAGGEGTALRLGVVCRPVEIAESSSTHGNNRPGGIPTGVESKTGSTLHRPLPNASAEEMAGPVAGKEGAEKPRVNGPAEGVSGWTPIAGERKKQMHGKRGGADTSGTTGGFADESPTASKMTAATPSTEQPQMGAVDITRFCLLIEDYLLTEFITKAFRKSPTEDRAADEDEHSLVWMSVRRVLRFLNQIHLCFPISAAGKTQIEQLLDKFLEDTENKPEWRDAIAIAKSLRRQLTPKPSLLCQITAAKVRAEVVRISIPEPLVSEPPPPAQPRRSTTDSPEEGVVSGPSSPVAAQTPSPSFSSFPVVEPPLSLTVYAIDSLLLELHGARIPKGRPKPLPARPITAVSAKQPDAAPEREGGVTPVAAVAPPIRQTIGSPSHKIGPALVEHPRESIPHPRAGPAGGGAPQISKDTDSGISSARPSSAIVSGEAAGISRGPTDQRPTRPAGETVTETAPTGDGAPATAVPSSHVTTTRPSRESSTRRQPAEEPSRLRTQPPSGRPGDATPPSAQSPAGRGGQQPKGPRLPPPISADSLQQRQRVAPPVSERRAPPPKSTTGAVLRGLAEASLRGGPLGPPSELPVPPLRGTSPFPPLAIAQQRSASRPARDEAGGSRLVEPPPPASGLVPSGRTRRPPIDLGVPSSRGGPDGSGSATSRSPSRGRKRRRVGEDDTMVPTPTQPLTSAVGRGGGATSPPPPAEPRFPRRSDISSWASGGSGGGLPATTHGGSPSLQQPAPARRPGSGGYAEPPPQLLESDEEKERRLKAETRARWLMERNRDAIIPPPTDAMRGSGGSGGSLPLLPPGAGGDSRRWPPTHGGPRGTSAGSYSSAGPPHMYPRDLPPRSLVGDHRAGGGTSSSGAGGGPPGGPGSSHHRPPPGHHHHPGDRPVSFVPPPHPGPRYGSGGQGPSGNGGAPAPPGRDRGNPPPGRFPHPGQILPPSEAPGGRSSRGPPGGGGWRR